VAERDKDVGTRIVGDVLVGLLDFDLSSVRHAPAGWRPRASLIELLTDGIAIASASVAKLGGR